MSETAELPRDYTMDEVAEALQMSPRWVRLQVSNGAAHQRYGHVIRFTAEQVAELRASRVKVTPPQSITTGRKKKSA